MIAIQKKGTFEYCKIYHDDSDDASQLEGATSTACSPDGNYLYVVSGRFRGDNAVSVFEIGEEGRLKLLQELVNETDLTDFLGGNHVAVSPDGQFVYASAAKSNNVACFKRNLDDGTLEFDSYLEIDGESNLGTTAGIHVSQDNRFVFIAGEARKSVYVFERAKRND